MSTAIRDGIVDVPGGRVFVCRWGERRRDRPPIVLLHDSLGSVDGWRSFPNSLANATGREVVAYDRLGFGRSTPRTERPSIDFIREEAEIYFPSIRRALDLGRFTLLGHSVGGAMALAIAASERDRCDAVVTVAAQSYVEPRTLSGIRAAKAQFYDREQFERLARRHGEKARWVLDAWTEVWLSPEFRSWSLDGLLAEVRCPVLAIHGDADEYGSVAFAQRIVGAVGGPSQLEILAGCGHSPHREREQELLHLIASFLRRHEVGGG